MNRDRWFVWICLILAVASQFYAHVVVVQKNDVIKSEKSVSEVYRQEALHQNSLYEGALDDEAQLKKDLANVRKQLAVSAKREAAAKVRASRSRSAEPKRRVSSVESGGSYSGKLRNITMYCTGSVTASGKRPSSGMVATISRSIPFGTRVSIEGVGTFVVEDRIGHGSEFDIYTSSCSEANGFGRKLRRVTVLS